MTTARHKLNQWNDTTRLPVMEYKLSNGDYLVVALQQILTNLSKKVWRS